MLSPGVLLDLPDSLVAHARIFAANPIDVPVRAAFRRDICRLALCRRT